MKTSKILTLTFTGFLFFSFFNSQAQSLRELREAAKALGGNKNKEKSSEDIEEEVAGANFSIDFDYRKNQLTYAQEFFADDATIYQMTWDRDFKKFTVGQPYDPSQQPKNFYT